MATRNFPTRPKIAPNCAENWAAAVTCSSVIVSAALIHRFLSEYWKSMSSKRATFPMISPHARFVPLSSSSARIAEAYMWK